MSEEQVIAPATAPDAQYEAEKKTLCHCPKQHDVSDLRIRGEISSSAEGCGKYLYVMPTKDDPDARCYNYARSLLNKEVENIEAAKKAAG